MAVFVDRKSQFPNRRRLIPVKNENNVFDVERVEGVIYNPGTAWNATTMNNLFHEVIKFTPEIYSSGNHNRRLNLTPNKEGTRIGYFAHTHNICILYVYLRQVSIQENSPGAYYEIKVRTDDDKSFLSGLNLSYRAGAMCVETYVQVQGTDGDNLFADYPPSLEIVPGENIDYLHLYKRAERVGVQSFTTEIDPTTGDVIGTPYTFDLCCSIPFIVT